MTPMTITLTLDGETYTLTEPDDPTAQSAFTALATTFVQVGREIGQLPLDIDEPEVPS